MAECHAHLVALRAAPRGLAARRARLQEPRPRDVRLARAVWKSALTWLWEQHRSNDGEPRDGGESSNHAIQGEREQRTVLQMKSNQDGGHDRRRREQRKGKNQVMESQHD